MKRILLAVGLSFQHSTTVRQQACCMPRLWRWPVKTFLFWMTAALIIASLSFTCAYSAYGQGCTPTNASPSTHIETLLDPSQVPGVTATVNVADANGIASPSHFLTAGAWTNLIYTFLSRNGVSAKRWVTYPPDTTRYYQDSAPLNGTLNAPGGGNGPGGTGPSTTWFEVTDQYGNTTLDRVPMNFTSAPAGTIVSSDGIAANMYLQETASLDGTPAYNWADCHGGMMIMQSATHQPFATVQLSNKASGETRPLVKVAGAVQAAMSGTTVNRLTISGSDLISVLPEDLVDGNNITADGETYFLCSAAGKEWGGPMYIVIEVATTAVDIDGPGTPDPNNPGFNIWPVAPFCDPHCAPPDFAPRNIHTNLAPPHIPNYWITYSLCSGLAINGTVNGWLCAADVLDNFNDESLTWAEKLARGTAEPFAPSPQDKVAGGVDDCTNWNRHINSYGSVAIPVWPIILN